MPVLEIFNSLLIFSEPVATLAVSALGGTLSQIFPTLVLEYYLYFSTRENPIPNLSLSSVSVIFRLN